MPCTQPNITAAHLVDWDGAPQLQVSAQSVGALPLFMSDNPELITNAHIPLGPVPGGVVLWSYQVNLNTAIERRIRAFLWHVNTVTRNIRVGLTLQNLSDNAADVLVVPTTATRERSISGGDFFDIGKCIAKATLGGTQGEFLQNPIVLNPGAAPGQAGPVTVLDDAQVNAAPVAGQYGQHYFACYEFRVRRQDNAVGRLHFMLRSATDTANITTQTGPPPAAQPANQGELFGHARGTWPYSRIRLDMPAPYVYGSGMGVIQLATRLPNNTSVTPDVELFRERYSDPGEGTGVKANKGMYGVDYNPIWVQASNPTNVARTVRVRVGTLVAQSTPFVLGLVGAMDNGPGVRGIPTDAQQRMDALPSGVNVVFVQDLQIPPNQVASGMFTFQVGGNSTTPWWIIFHDLP